MAGKKDDVPAKAEVADLKELVLEDDENVLKVACGLPEVLIYAVEGG